MSCILFLSLVEEGLLCKTKKESKKEKEEGNKEKKQRRELE